VPAPRTTPARCPSPAAHRRRTPAWPQRRRDPGNSPWLTAAMEREAVEAAGAMFMSAVRRQFAPVQPDPVASPARVRGDDPGRHLFEPLFDIGARQPGEIEYAVVC